MTQSMFQLLVAPRGRGPCVAIPGGPLCPVFLQDLPMCWTVGISPRGVGLTGRGNSFPLPCLLRSQNSEYLTDPVRVPCRWLPKELAGGGPRPARALRRDTHTLLPATPSQPAPL